MKAGTANHPLLSRRCSHPIHREMHPEDPNIWQLQTVLQLTQLQGEFTRLPGFKKGGEVASLLEAERGVQASALQLSQQRVALLNEGLSTQVNALLSPLASPTPLLCTCACMQHIQGMHSKLSVSSCHQV